MGPGCGASCVRRKRNDRDSSCTSMLLVVFAAVLIAVCFIVAPLLSEDRQCSRYDRDRGCIGLRTSEAPRYSPRRLRAVRRSEGTITLSRGSSSADAGICSAPGLSAQRYQALKAGIGSVASISASRAITEPKSLSTYRLDNPALTGAGRTFRRHDTQLRHRKLQRVLECVLYDDRRQQYDLYRYSSTP